MNNFGVKMMAVNSNDSRVRKTKKLIRKGLTELAECKSINSITVKELTNLVGINRGTFYLHYKDVDELVNSIEDEMYTEFEKFISNVNPASIIEAPVELLDKFCHLLYENADTCGVLISENGDPGFADKIGALVSDKCVALFSEIHPDLNKERYEIIYEYCKYGAVGIVRSWLLDHPDWSTHQIAELWFNLIYRGVKGILSDKRKCVN